MSATPHKTLFGLSPKRYGIISLIAACLVLVSPLLNIVVGVALWLVVLCPLVLIGVAFGLLGLGMSVYYRDLLGSAMAVLGLVSIGLLIWWFAHSVTHF